MEREGWKAGPQSFQRSLFSGHAKKKDLTGKSWSEEWPGHGSLAEGGSKAGMKQSFFTVE